MDGPPALTRLDGCGNPPYAVDFRELHVTVLESWRGTDPVRALKGCFAPLGVIRA